LWLRQPRGYPSYAYWNSALGAATNETAVIGTNVFTLTRTLDDRHRLAELSADGEVHAVYSYDAENRIASVSNAAFAATYAYTADGLDAGYTLTLTNGTVITRALTRDSYRRGLVAIITNRVNGTPVTPFSYTFDRLDRIASRNADTVGYNSRSEVTSADISTNAYRYTYDEIGNSRFAAVNASTNLYTANALNQYTNILCASAPPREDTLFYDLDGNLLTNGSWSYTWDCENRLPPYGLIWAG
jgi:hypothetical protein